MELSSDNVLINGFKVSSNRANTIMFVQCTMLKKKYDVDMESHPGFVSITIDGYNPDENDMKPDSEEPNMGTAVPATREKSETQSTPKVSKCGSCNK